MMEVLLLLLIYPSVCLVYSLVDFLFFIEYDSLNYPLVVCIMKCGIILNKVYSI